MDSLTFGTKILLKGFNNKKEPVLEINFEDMLKGLEMTYDEFVDLCILCGCDYTTRIEGVGPVTAFKLIKEHTNLEGILEHFESSKSKGKSNTTIPTGFHYEDARELFKTPKVDDPASIELKWNPPDEEALKAFLCGEKGFSDTRIENALKKMKVIFISKSQYSKIFSFRNFN
jgi:flap endonuclease-1